MDTMKTKQNADAIVDEFLKKKLEAIRKLYAPQHLIVFGSRATGSATVDSDIDIIVVSEHFRDVRYVKRMGEFLVNIRPDVHVDALCFTPEEFQTALTAQSPFIRNAVDEGLQVI